LGSFYSTIPLEPWKSQVFFIDLDIILTLEGYQHFSGIMAELDIKPDPDGPLGNMTPIQIEADSSSLFVNEDTPMPPSDPAWKICGHESIERRVKIKEDAVASCILIMKKPREQLEALDLHGKEYPELQEWFRKSGMQLRNNFANCTSNVRIQMRSSTAKRSPAS
jgi:hypothetical protein